MQAASKQAWGWRLGPGPAVTFHGYGSTTPELFQATTLITAALPVR